MKLVVNASPIIFLTKIDYQTKPYLLKLKDTGYRINDQLFDYALKLAD